MYPSLFRVLPSGMNSQWTMGVKSFQRDLSFPVSTRNFCIELMMMVSTAFFFCRSYKKRHVSSPVIMFLRDFFMFTRLTDNVTGNSFSYFFYFRASAFDLRIADKSSACSTCH